MIRCNLQVNPDGTFKSTQSSCTRGGQAPATPVAGTVKLINPQTCTLQINYAYGRIPMNFLHGTMNRSKNHINGIGFSKVDRLSVISMYSGNKL
jgi:hypothetical protein